MERLEKEKEKETTEVAKYKCEFGNCTFEGTPDGFRWVKGKKEPMKKEPMMYQITLFRINEKGQREIAEVIPGKGARPVTLHWTHAFQVANLIKEKQKKGDAFEFEMKSLKKALSDDDFNLKVKYWEMLERREVEEPSPQMTEKMGERCGVPVGGIHSDRIVRFYLNRKNQVVGLCSRCVAAFAQVHPSHLRISKNREKLEEIANKRARDSEELERISFLLAKGYRLCPKKSRPKNRRNRQEGEKKIWRGKEGRRRDNEVNVEEEEEKLNPDNSDPVPTTLTPTPNRGESLGSILASKPTSKINLQKIKNKINS
jgi:hypothetical protein